MASCLAMALWGWCGECYANRRGRSRYGGHFGFRGKVPIRRVHVPQFAKRPVSAPGQPIGVSGPPHGGLEAAYPALWEYLTLREWGPNEPRDTASLLIFNDEGILKACVNDRDALRVAFVAAGSLTLLLSSLEAGLVADTLDWRLDRKGKGKRKV